MQIFVVGTGRCGTSTFYNACQHVTNYTCRHEICYLHLIKQQLINAIEVNGGLTFFIPQLRRQYQRAKWVHMIRDREACIKSLAEQAGQSVRYWANVWLQWESSDAELPVAAGLFYDSVNDLIVSQLPEVFTFRLESAYEQDWPEFWDWAKCKGRFESSRVVWRRHYNSGEFRGRDNSTSPSRALIVRPKYTISLLQKPSVVYPNRTR